ncbi:hypothetical protein Cni_G00126 [Canna indica]|uniref:Phytocyanin domain-containing protein n=1 Tax=Canna indica TaxID=4628 RepID=A0AAQ3PYZ0_9LILI|nr:hypothetical protein Cni_G00126 [Canna indica]
MEANGSLASSLLLVGVLMGLATCSWSYDFNVGGRDGWVPNPSESYSSWAGRNRFQVNDTLVFKYSQGVDSVLVVTKQDYDACNASNPIQKLEGGDSVFKLDRSGPFYFISGVPENCQKGQKLAVVVLAIRNKNPPLPPAVSPVLPPPSTSPTASPAVSPVLPPPSNSPTASPAVSPVLPPPSNSPMASPAPSPAFPASPAPSPAFPASPSPSPSPALSPAAAPSVSGPSPSPATTNFNTPPPAAAPAALQGPASGPPSPGGPSSTDEPSVSAPSPSSAIMDAPRITLGLVALILASALIH